MKYTDIEYLKLTAISIFPHWNKYESLFILIRQIEFASLIELQHFERLCLDVFKGKYFKFQSSLTKKGAIQFRK